MIGLTLVKFLNSKCTIMGIAKRNAKLLSETEKQDVIKRFSEAVKSGASWGEKSLEVLRGRVIGGIEFEEGDLLCFPAENPCYLKSFNGVDGKKYGITGFFGAWKHSKTGYWTELFVPSTMFARHTYRDKAGYYAEREEEGRRLGYSIDRLLLKSGSLADIQSFISGHTILVWVKDLHDLSVGRDENGKVITAMQTTYGFVQLD